MRLWSLTRQHHNLELLVSQDSIDIHTFVTAWEMFGNDLLPMLGKRMLWDNPWGRGSSEVDVPDNYNDRFVIIPTYTTWLRYFIRTMTVSLSSRSKHSRIWFVVVCVPSGFEEIQTVLAILIVKGVQFALAPLYVGSLCRQFNNARETSSTYGTLQCGHSHWFSFLQMFLYEYYASYAAIRERENARWYCIF